MTPDNFRAARKSLGLTQPVMAEWLRKSPRTIKAWEAGEVPVDETAILLMRAYLSGWRDT